MLKTYVIDIDGTICDKDVCRKDGDYETSIPKLDRIEKINLLFDKGNKIKYFTARGMGRHQDDAKLAHLEFYNLTRQQLDLWGCKYHELILGKPSGDIYIDDKGVNADDFFN
jgi:phosphatidate phosphatase PAH1